MGLNILKCCLRKVVKVILFENKRKFKDLVVTIGTFDGLHLGHQKVFNYLQKTGNQLKKKTAIISFHPHPRHFLYPNLKTDLLTTIDEKKDILNTMPSKPDYFIVIPFDKNLSSLEGKDFLHFLKDFFSPSSFVIGDDHHFGKEREAGVEDIKEYCTEENIPFQLVSSMNKDDVRVSSSLIRKILSTGDVLKARNFLGYPYLIKSKVIKGLQNGSKIGFPTANLDNDINKKLVPKNGVYYTKIKIDNTLFNSVTNIGFRPTINNGNKRIQVETNIFNFDTNIYGKEVSLTFFDRIRDEKKFNSLEDLKQQISNDVNHAKDFFLQQTD